MFFFGGGAWRAQKQPNKKCHCTTARHHYGVQSRESECVCVCVCVVCLYLADGTRVSRGSSKEGCVAGLQAISTNVQIGKEGATKSGCVFVRLQSERNSSVAENGQQALDAYSSNSGKSERIIISSGFWLCDGGQGNEKRHKHRQAHHHKHKHAITRTRTHAQQQKHKQVSTHLPRGLQKGQEAFEQAPVEAREHSAQRWQPSWPPKPWRLDSNAAYCRVCVALLCKHKHRERERREREREEREREKKKERDGKEGNVCKQKQGCMACLSLWLVGGRGTKLRYNFSQAENSWKMLQKCARGASPAQLAQKGKPAHRSPTHVTQRKLLQTHAELLVSFFFFLALFVLFCLLSTTQPHSQPVRQASHWLFCFSISCSTSLSLSLSLFVC